LFWSPEHSPAAYRDPFELFADAVDLLRQDVYELASLGCEYIQIDAPELATIVDESIRRTVWQAIGVPPARMLSEGIEMLNAIAYVPGVIFGLHMCGGNNQGRWLSAAHGNSPASLAGCSLAYRLVYCMRNPLRIYCARY